MNGVTRIPFSDLGNVIAGQHIPAEQYNGDESGTPYLTGPADFTDRTPVVTKWTNFPRSFSESGDVLLTVKGAGCGKSNLGVDGAIGRQLMALRPNKAKLDRNYLFAFIRSQEERICALGQGATVPGIAKGDIEKLQIPFFPLLEQRRIAAILDKADAIRLKREEGIRLTEDLLRSTFLEMFGDHVEKAKPLTELAEVVSGVAKGRKLNGRATLVPYLRVANVQDGFLNLDEIKMIEALPDEVESLALKDGDIVMTEGGDHDKLGRGAIWNASIPNCIHQNHVFRVRVDRRSILPTYFAAFLRTPQAKRYFLRCAKKTTNLASINMTQLRGLPVPVPSISLQRKFEEAVQTINGIAVTRKQATSEAASLFGSLVQRAFRGEL